MNWIKTSDMLPPSGKKVIAAYRNSAGNWRQIMAFWVAPKTEEANEEWEEGTAEYDEEADCYWVKSGWYEQIDNWDEYTSCAVGEGEVSHWQPRPEPPSDERREG